MTEIPQPPARRWWRWLLVAAGPAVLVLLFMRVGPDQILAAIAHADPGRLGIAAALAVPALLLRTLRWQILMGRDGEGMRYVEITAIFAYAVFVGSATPGRVGEFLKILHLRERGIPTGRALASVLLDRLLDVAMLLSMAAGGFALLAGGDDIVVGVSAVGLFVIVMWTARAVVCGGPSRVIGGMVGPLVGERIRDKVGGLRAGLCSALDELPYRALGSGTALTIAAWGVNYYANYQLALALDLPLTYFDVAGVSAVASLVVLLPVSVAGAGTRDLAMVGLLAAYGVARPEALALSTMFLVFIIWNALMCSLSLASPGVRLARSR